MHHHPPGTSPISKTIFSFDSLPNEIILDILPRIADPASLCNLLHASPTALRAFNENGPARITESVLTSGYTCRQIQFMFRFCAMSKSCQFPPWTNSDFYARAFLEPMLVEHRLSPPQEAYEPEPLGKDTRLDAIHVLLRTARDITKISLNYLADSLRLFRSLEPQQPVDEHFKFCSAGTHPDAMSQEMEALTLTAQPSCQAAWECQPKTKKLEVTDIGWPTWTEEQRVMRAFWRLEIAYESDFANSTRKMTSTASQTDWWSSYSIAIHRPIRLHEPLHDNNADCYDSESPALYSEDMHWPHETPPTTPNPEYQELISVLDYIGERFGQEEADEMASNVQYISFLLDWELSPSAWETAGKFLDKSRKWPMPMPTGNDEETLLHPSASVRRTFKRPSPDAQDGYSPLGFFGLAPFSRYGFAFWCDERMQGYGLAAPKEHDVSSLQARIDWAWLSLLTPEEFASVKEKHVGSMGLN